jgi:hypothetical protein
MRRIIYLEADRKISPIHLPKPLLMEEHITSVSVRTFGDRVSGHCHTTFWVFEAIRHAMGLDNPAAK